MSDEVVDVPAFVSTIICDKMVKWRTREACALFLVEWIRLSAEIAEMMKRRKLTRMWADFAEQVRLKLNQQMQTSYRSRDDNNLRVSAETMASEMREFLVRNQPLA